MLMAFVNSRWLTSHLITTTHKQISELAHYLCTMHIDELISSWKALKVALKPQFGDDIDMQAILFIIGMQELGHGPKKLEKEGKVDIMHVAICTLLEPLGYYLYKGRDEDNWPHWENAGKMPHMTAMEQNRFMQIRIIEYFRKQGLI